MNLLKHFYKFEARRCGKYSWAFWAMMTIAPATAAVPWQPFVLTIVLAFFTHKIIDTAGLLENDFIRIRPVSMFGYLFRLRLAMLFGGGAVACIVGNLALNIMVLVYLLFGDPHFVIGPTLAWYLSRAPMILVDMLAAGLRFALCLTPLVALALFYKKLSHYLLAVAVYLLLVMVALSFTMPRCYNIENSPFGLANAARIVEGIPTLGTVLLTLSLPCIVGIALAFKKGYSKWIPVLTFGALPFIMISFGLALPYGGIQSTTAHDGPAPAVEFTAYAMPPVIHRDLRGRIIGNGTEQPIYVHMAMPSLNPDSSYVVGWLNTPDLKESLLRSFKVAAGDDSYFGSYRHNGNASLDESLDNANVIFPHGKASAYIQPAGGPAESNGLYIAEWAVDRSHYSEISLEEKFGMAKRSVPQTADIGVGFSVRKGKHGYSLNLNLGELRPPVWPTPYLSKVQAVFDYYVELVTADGTACPGQPDETYSSLDTTPGMIEFGRGWSCHFDIPEAIVQADGDKKFRLKDGHGTKLRIYKRTFVGSWKIPAPDIDSMEIIDMHPIRHLESNTDK